MLTKGNIGELKLLESLSIDEYYTTLVNYLKYQEEQAKELERQNAKTKK